jgi:plasmid maintenance system antidote protein VapI
MPRTIQTNYAVPLSEFIEEILEETEVTTLDELAAKMGPDVTKAKAVLNDIMANNVPLTVEASELLTLATGVKADFWMRLDALYWEDATRLGLV